MITGPTIYHFIISFIYPFIFFCLLLLSLFSLLWFISFSFSSHFCSFFSCCFLCYFPPVFVFIFILSFLAFNFLTSISSFPPIILHPVLSLFIFLFLCFLHFSFHLFPWFPFIFVPLFRVVQQACLWFTAILPSKILYIINIQWKPPHIFTSDFRKTHITSSNP